MLSLSARQTLQAIQQSLPTGEWAAVELWLESFYRYQLEILLDWGRRSLANKSRQIGFSHTLAALMVLWSIFGEENSIVSIGERESEEVLAKAEKHAAALVALGSEWARCRKSGNCLHFAGGGKITAFPNSSAARSFAGNVLLDEIAYYPHDPAVTWDSASGSTLHGYRLRANSTPNGVGNFWHQLWTDPAQHAGYKLHEYSIEDAIADGLDVDIEDCWRMARGDKRVFDQMFRCSFLDGDQQYLPEALLESCLWPRLGNDAEGKPLEKFPTIPTVGDTYAGLDIGKTVDLTALVVIRVTGPTRWAIHVETRSRTNQQDIYDLAAKAFGPKSSGGFECSKLGVDATGLGTFPAEALVKQYGMRRVIPVTFGLASKEDMATGIFEYMQQGNARIPRTHVDPVLASELQKLKVDLSSLRRLVTERGNISYDAPHTSAGHADRAWAYALAMMVARRQAVRGVVT